MLILYLVFLGFSLVQAGPIQNYPEVLKRDSPKTLVSSDVYANLVYYAQFPSSGQNPCTDPPAGVVEQEYLNSTATATQAPIFRIDDRKEFILAVPGTSDLQDFLTDVDLFFTTYESSGVTCKNCAVYSGFLIAWNSISTQVEDGLTKALSQYPNYTVSISGHSLSAGISELAFGSLKPQSFNVGALYTYGGPRVGNRQYGDYIDQLSGASDTENGTYYRITHYNDIIPLLPPSFLGYVHPRGEYWESNQKATLNATFQCFGQEPFDCSNTVFPDITSDAHTTYAGMKSIC